MQSTTGCKINVSPPSGQDFEREIGLVGSRMSIDQAKRAILDKVQAVVSVLDPVSGNKSLTTCRKRKTILAVVVVEEDVVMILTMIATHRTSNNNNHHRPTVSLVEYNSNQWLRRVSSQEPMPTLMRHTAATRTMSLYGTTPWRSKDSNQVKYLQVKVRVRPVDPDLPPFLAGEVRCRLTCDSTCLMR